MAGLAIITESAVMTALLFSTGYSPIGKALDYSICEEYDKKARAIIENYGLTYEQQKAEVKALLDEFIQRISE